MADLSLNIPNATYASAFQEIYKGIPRQTITPTAISLAERTKADIASEVDASMRPYMDMAAAQRQQAAVQSRAELDADAYSRGMGSSTWLTDKKSRESMAAQTDISNIKAQYSASLADSINTQLQNYTSNKLAVDQANVSNKLSADQFNANQEDQAYQKAYGIFMDMWDKGLFAPASTGSGSGSGSGSGDLTFDFSTLGLDKTGNTGAGATVGGTAPKDQVKAFAVGVGADGSVVLGNPTTDWLKYK